LTPLHRPFNLPQVAPSASRLFERLLHVVAFMLSAHPRSNLIASDEFRASVTIPPDRATGGSKAAVLNLWCLSPARESCILLNDDYC
jgi:hypothetical protein